MSDDSDFDDVAHEKLLQSIKLPGSIKKGKLKTGKTAKIDATSLLSHITVSRVSTKNAKKSLGVGGQDTPENEKDEENPDKQTNKKKRKLKENKDEEDSKKKILKSKTLLPLKNVEARKKLEGQIAYEDLRKEVSESWGNLVKSNRVADQLIFPLTKPEGLLFGDEKEKPKLTKKEKELKKATDVKMAKERINQMQRMRAIVGIQEAKNRYMKKIKSKGYHRILKREQRKQLLKEFDELVTKDPKAAHEKLAELDMQRIMERGSLKHRGQNQKFKQMLEKHASRNPEVKSILEEHLRMGRELKAKIVTNNDDESDNELIEKDEENKEKKQNIHDVLKDAALEAAKESIEVGKTLVDSFLNDKDAQKITLAKMRAEKRRQAAAHTKNITAKEVGEQMFDVEEKWNEKKMKKTEKKEKRIIQKKSFVPKNYVPKKGELSYEEKVDLAVDAAGVNDEEKKRIEISIDPKKFLELNTSDLTQVSSEFVEKMDQFDEETANVINEAFKDDDVVGDFETVKERVEEKEKVKDIDLNLAGWGSWAGPGTTEKKRRNNFIIKAKEKKRKDGEKNGLIIKESLNLGEGIGKIQPKSLPFPYTRVQDYEAVLKQPLGLEWNMENVRDELCKPSVVVEAGRAIRPINKKELIGED